MDEALAAAQQRYPGVVVLHRGHSAATIRASDANGNPFAIKIVPLNPVASVDEKILKNIEKLYRSHHDCIVAYLGTQYMSTGHSILVATEYMDGGSLRDLRNRFTFPEPVLAKMTYQILRGLEYLHDHRKVIHRDIKPSNLLINSRGQIKISDFGLASAVIEMSRCTTWLGTQLYMSPERISGIPYSSVSDIWSLGITCVELAIGRCPYDMAQTPFDLLDRIIEQDPPNVPPEQFSPEMRDFVGNCLKKKQEQRPHATQLLKHAWFTAHKDLDLSAWIASLSSLPPAAAADNGGGGAAAMVS